MLSVRAGMGAGWWVTCAHGSVQQMCAPQQVGLSADEHGQVATCCRCTSEAGPAVSHSSAPQTSPAWLGPAAPPGWPQ